MPAGTVYQYLQIARHLHSDLAALLDKEEMPLYVATALCSVSTERQPLLWRRASHLKSNVDKVALIKSFASKPKEMGHKKSTKKNAPQNVAARIKASPKENGSRRPKTVKGDGFSSVSRVTSFFH